MQKLIVRHIVDDMKSLKSVESPTFRAIIHAAVPELNICRKTLGTKRKSEMEEVKQRIIGRLGQIDYVSTTADIWSARQRSYIGVTCHWIDPEKFVRCSVILGFRRFKGQRNYLRIAEVLNAIHSEYGLDTTKVTYVITDNGSNFLKAFREYGIQNGESPDEDENDSDARTADDMRTADISVILDNVSQDDDDDDDIEIPYLPKHASCAAHTLNLLMTKDTEAALENSAYKSLYRSTTAKCTSITNAVHRSSLASETAHEVIGRTIPKPNDIRWNGQFDSYQTISKVSANVNKLMEKLKLPKFKESELEFLAE